MALHRITCDDGGVLNVRPIVGSDADRLGRMFDRLSRQSVYFRFFSPIIQLPRATLLQLADVDHRRRDALVALDHDEIVAVARYDDAGHLQRCDGSRGAEVAVTVEDAWQHRGVGKQLVCGVAALARQRGYDHFIARILPQNRAALALARGLVPDASVRFTGGDYEVHLPLGRKPRT
jgi:GNAT superfamily N-acetyltransferase